MILDALTQMSSEQAVTETAASTSFIDTKAAGQMMKPLTALLEVITTTDSAGDAAVLNFVIQTDTEPTFSSPVTIATLPEKAQAALIAGAQFQLILPKTGIQRYIRGYYTVTGADFTAGAFSLALLKDADIETIS